MPLHLHAHPRQFGFIACLQPSNWRFVAKTSMASTASLEPPPPPSGLETEVAGSDFSDDRMKPAPLRLVRKNTPSAEKPKSPDGQATVPGGSPRPENAVTVSASPANVESPPAATRQPEPSLFPVTLKHDVLEQIRQFDLRSLSHPSSPGRGPATPSPPSPLSLIPRHEPLFADGSPVRRLPRITVPRPDRNESPSHDSNQVLPTSITLSPALKVTLRPAVKEGTSPLHRDEESQLDDSKSQAGEGGSVEN